MTEEGGELEKRPNEEIISWNDVTAGFEDRGKGHE